MEGDGAIATIVAKDAGVTLTGTPPPERTGKRAHRNPANSIITWIVLLALLSLILGTRGGRQMLPWLLLGLALGGGRGGSHSSGGFGGFGGGFGGFGGGMSGGGGAGGSF